MRKIPNLRWVIVGLLFTATAISYVDRQNLTVVAPTLRDELGISNFGYARILFAFLLSYTIMQGVTGWLVDRLGTRKGFALVMFWWSIAAILHCLGRGVVSFSAFRFLLGMGEAGSWAACVKAVSEWFPPQERGLANGIWGAGTSAGMVVSVPIVAWIALSFGWRYTFLLTGLLGFLWLAAWMALYRLPGEHRLLTEQEGQYIARGAVPDLRPRKGSFRRLLSERSVWAVILARLLADPVVWFYNYWIPEFLKRSEGFSLAEIGKYGWIPFLTQGIGIVLGGILSDALLRRNGAVIRSRLTVMLGGVLLMAGGLLAAFPVSLPLVFTGLSSATFGFGLWAPNMMSLCGEAFPPEVVGSVTGLSGVGAGVGGMIFTLLTGWLLDHAGYPPVFMAAAAIPMAAFLVLYALLDRKAVPPAGTREIAAETILTK